jgi:signal transduction histidine kinase
MLHSFLRDHRDEVIALAEQQLQTTLRDKPTHEVIDHLPLIIDQIIQELGSDDGAGPETKIKRTAAEHGEQRAKLGIPIDIVVHDYGVICDSMSEVAKRQRQTVSAEEWQVVNRALDIGIAAAIQRYETELREQQRRENAEYVGSVAHEIRNALSSVTIAYQAIKRGRVGQSGRTAEILDRGLSRLNELTAQLLDDSKASFDTPAALETIEIRSFVDDLLQGISANRGVTFEVDIAPDVRTTADPRLLHAALGNLIQNAVKFTGPATSVKIRAQERADEITIEVEDACGGLAPGLEDQLFRPFVQANGDRTGAGLGLSIARKAADASRGRVGVRNVPGQGCVFALTLPKRRDS